MISRSAGTLNLLMVGFGLTIGASPARSQQSILPAPTNWTAAEDHQQMMEQLGIKALRPGPSGNEQAPNHANYDEATANPYPELPDVLTLKNGQKVTTRRSSGRSGAPEIVEDFEREVLGRVPEERAEGDVDGHRNRHGTRRRKAGDRAAADRPRRQLLVSRASTSTSQMTLVVPGEREGRGAGDDDVRRRRSCSGARSSRTAAGGSRRSSAPPPPAPAAIRRRRSNSSPTAGAIASQSDEHSGRQRRRAHEGHHRPRQQGSAAQAGRLGRAARLGLGRIARARLPRDRHAVDAKQRRHRRRVALRQGRARHDGLRPALRASSSSARRAKAAPSCTAATGAKRSRTSPAPASITGWPATS